MNRHYISWPWLLLLGLMILCLLPAMRAAATTGASSPQPQQAQATTALVINEVDVDQTGTDTAEFIELYDGGVGNVALTGLVLVWFNGGDDKSYRSFDLDGYATNGNGYFVLGNSLVAGAAITFTNGSLQNGPDAVALYTANGSDFPNGTVVTTNNLLDALVYDVDQADDAGLLVLLNSGQPQVNEAGAGDATTASMQRCPNGSGGQRNTTAYLPMPPSPNGDNSCGGATSTPTATPTAATTPTPTVTPTSTPLTGVGIAAPTGASGIVGSEVLLPIRLFNSANGSALLGYEFQLQYNPAVLQSIGLSTTNTASAGWQVIANSDTPGRLRVAGYGTSPLSGDGVLLNLRFQVTQTVNLTSALTFGYFRWNEGQPTAATQAGDFRTRMLGIGGAVLYGVSGEPVPQVALALSGAQSANTATDAQGAYHFNLAGSGPISVTLSKTGDAGAALSALDAAWILQCTVNLRPSAACPLAASDSSGDGQVSAYDAALLARHLVGFTTPPSAAGQWRFTPPSRSYPALTTDLPQEDYTAYLVGDVTGNWASGGTVTSAAAQATVSSAITARGAQAHMAVRVGLAAPVLGYQLTVQHNPTTVQFSAVAQDNTRNASWQLLAHESAPGFVRVVAYGIAPLVLPADAPLLTLRFQTTDAFDPATDLRLDTVRVNEDQLVTPTRVLTLQKRLFLPLVATQP
jgi:hypothetical protein